MMELLRALDLDRSKIEAAQKESPPCDPRTVLAVNQRKIALNQAAERIVERLDKEDLPQELVWRAQNFAVHEDRAVDMEAWLQGPGTVIPDDCWAVRITEDVYDQLTEDANE